MSECGQAYPEYIASVADLGKSHEGQTTKKRCTAQHNCIQISFLQRILEIMCPGLSTRECPLPVTCGHLVAKAHYTQ